MVVVSPPKHAKDSRSCILRIHHDKHHDAALVRLLYKIISGRYSSNTSNFGPHFHQVAGEGTVVQDEVVGSEVVPAGTPGQCRTRQGDVQFGVEWG